MTGTVIPFPEAAKRPPGLVGKLRKQEDAAIAQMYAEQLMHRQREAVAMIRSGASRLQVGRKHGPAMATWALGLVWEDNGFDKTDAEGRDAWLKANEYMGGGR